jgi:hypothetical protein
MCEGSIDFTERVRRSHARDTTPVLFAIADCDTIPETAYPGESGTAPWRTLQVGDLIRMVHYSPGYVADHWCDRGHVVLVLSGQLITELQDGSVHRLAAGMSYRVADGKAPHRSRTVDGDALFIVD